MEQTLLLFRMLFLTGCGVAGWYVAFVNSDWQAAPWLGSFSGLAIGLFVILVDRLVRGVSLRAFSCATFGLFLGSVLAWLVMSTGLFRYTTENVQWVLRLGIYLVFGYLGTMLALRSNRDEFSLIIPYVRLVPQRPTAQTWILDTSAMMDGRFSDLCQCGYLWGVFVIPHFVLQEIQNLADHSDSSKRMRGRQTLELLSQLKNLPTVDLKIQEPDHSEESTDSRLIHLAHLYSGSLITTDHNLSRIAEIQKVRVLNIHHLANVLKLPITTGERLRLKLVREGKEAHQAVGFLPDGTMIVVNQARSLVGQEAEVRISGSIQTSAGRMVFAELDASSSKFITGKSS